jgi:hypothetical protein
VNEELLRLLREDPDARRCYAFVTGAEPTLDALTACYAGDAADAHRSRPASAGGGSPARDDEGRRIRHPSPSSLPSEDGILAVPLAEYERLKTCAAWTDEAQYEAFFGEPPRC